MTNIDLCGIAQLLRTLILYRIIPYALWRNKLLSYNGYSKSIFPAKVQSG